MIAPIVKYPGAKNRIGDWLQRHTPRMPRVVDVYGGSGAYLLNLWYTPKHLVYNDIDRDLQNLFAVIRNPATRAELCDAVALTLWSRAEYLDVTARNGRILATGEPVEDARRYLIATWQACKTNTSTRNGWRNMGATNTTMESSTWQVWRQLPERIRIAGERLQCAEIECRPALEIIQRYANAETLIYADPPYLRTTIHGTRRRLYRHEMDEADHVALLDALEAHPGPVLLSGYDNALYAARLASWAKRTMEARAEGNAPRVECLWLNQVAVERLGNGPLFEGVDI